ncbi:mediator of RNA polymerase II transcription subunit 15a-like isoform X3 [Solanum tuberosum]|uniref:mediator of RNA polymerase II transcription subunit 15a-like isoform X3 n=1 Tax=Solanum tuberosum TaxID=4113 RepID=UPI0003D24672|nr:PREDICTED: mediator of RNA polymerase II transcription subunit 15a-like isoform X3 [Solanum tuberosum]
MMEAIKFFNICAILNFVLFVAPLDSTVQTGNANGGDWQEKVYEKIKSMKEMYVQKLYRLYQKIAYELQLSLHQRRTNEQIEKLKLYKIALERILCFLGLSKHDIQPAHKEKLLSVEKLINFFFSPSQQRKPTSSPVQERLPQSSMLLQQPQSLDGQTNPSMQPVHGPWKHFSILQFRREMQMGLIGTWQEEVYQKIKSMKEMYYSKLYHLYQKIAYELQQQNSLHQCRTNEQIEKLKMCKITLERIMLYLQLNKHYIQLAHKEKLLSVEKHINFFLSPYQPPKPTSSPVQEQLPQSYMQLQLPQSLDGQTNPSMQPVQANLGTLQQNSNALQQSFPKKCKQQTVAEPAIKRAVPPSADAAATF